MFDKATTSYNGMGKFFEKEKMLTPDKYVHEEKQNPF